jgi:hypothetical protein
VVTLIVSGGDKQDHPGYVNPRLGLSVQMIPLRTRIMKWKWIVLHRSNFLGVSHATGLENAAKFEAIIKEDLYVHPERWYMERGLDPEDRIRSGIGRDSAPVPPPPKLFKRRKRKGDDDSPDSDWELE